MTPSQYQALSTLLKERIYELEINFQFYREEVATHFEQARPETLLGQMSYTELNRAKNGLRSTRAKLRKWRALHAACAAEAKVYSTAWVPLKSESAQQFLQSVEVRTFSEGEGI